MLVVYQNNNNNNDCINNNFCFFFLCHLKNNRSSREYTVHFFTYIILCINGDEGVVEEKKVKFIVIFVFTGNNSNTDCISVLSDRFFFLTVFMYYLLLSNVTRFVFIRYGSSYFTYCPKYRPAYLRRGTDDDSKIVAKKKKKNV